MAKSKTANASKRIVSSIRFKILECFFYVLHRLCQNVFQKKRGIVKALSFMDLWFTCQKKA